MMGAPVVRLISVRSPVGERAGVVLDDRWAAIEDVVPDRPLTIMDFPADGDRVRVGIERIGVLEDVCRVEATAESAP
jgi:hypothetical protein